MKIEELRDCYYESTEKLSELVRTLGLAGIAVIWMFRSESENGALNIPSEFVSPLELFILSLLLDFFQYFYKSVTWGALNHFHWRSHRKNNRDVEISEKWNWGALFFFWSKVLSMMTGYIFLLISIRQKI